MRAQAAAALRLRGRDGRVRAEITWPADAPACTVVFVGDAHRELLCRRLAGALRAVTLSPARTCAHDARALVEWAADHAADLGASPDRLIVAGAHAGGGLAASLAVGARDDRWPPVVAQVLIHPLLLRADERIRLHDVAPAVVATDSAAGRRYADRLRAAGVPVMVLDDADPFARLAASVRAIAAQNVP